MSGNGDEDEFDREEFLELIKHIDQVLWLMDPRAGKMLYVSPGCETVWGVTADELYASPYAWIDRLPPDERGKAKAGLRGNEYRDDEYSVTWPDGTERVVRVRVFPIRDAERKTYRIAGVAEDVTGHRQMEDALEKREAELRQAQKMEAVGRLAGGVAHDFNNILTVIMGYSDYTLTQMGEKSERKGEIDEIRKAAERAAALTQRLLAFSRRQVVRPTLIDLNTVIAGLRLMIRRLIGDDIEIKVVAAPSLGRVLADHGQLEQVLMNLAVNARDAMPDGGKLGIGTDEVTVETPVPAKPADVPRGRYVTLTVSDTGCGMSQEVQSHIFEPFFTTKEVGKGTGLGLATIYGIVQQSEGYIAVESEEGNGTTFRIYLPRKEGPLKDSAPPPAPTLEKLRGSETVLLVEDEKEVREIARLILSESGYRVLEANGPAEAMWLSQRHHGTIHLLLTDIVMRTMNGFELADRLQPLHPEMKVMFMSGYTEYPFPESRKADPFLPKPFTPEELLSELRSVLKA